MKIEYYAIHYIETEVETEKDIVDKMVSVGKPEFVVEAIRKFVREHTNYECPTEIMQEKSPTISDAFVSHEGEKDYWLIIHTLTKEVEAES